MLANALVGFALALGVALLARRTGALTAGGAVAATVFGTLAFAAGWVWAVLLIAFFTSSLLLSRIRAKDRAKLLKGRIAKTGARDAAQVAANGGVFVLAALGWLVHPLAVWQCIGAAGLAASTADTWATELGTLAPEPPRSILTGRIVHAGTSGGVTPLGLLAGGAAAAFIAVVAGVPGWPWQAAVAAFVGGIAGCLADSVLGAALQVRRRCERCGMATEQVVHRCGTPTIVTGGLRWLDNDGVNAASTAIGALVGGGLGYFLS